MSPVVWLLCVFAFLFAYVLVAVFFMRAKRSQPAADWRTASRDCVGLAPDPAATSEAVVQVYAARALSWRGYFAVHPWVAVKRTGERAFTVYEVSGWWLRRHGTCVVTTHRPPDGCWFGNRPMLLADRRGPGVEELIGRIDAAVLAYPWKGRYRVWPGPNSNTFIAHVLRAVPQLRADLPPTAVGKDYLGMVPMARLPSGTGVQLNLPGLVGIAVGWEEGLEINLLGLTFGIDPRNLAIKLPIIGSLGLRCCTESPPSR